MSKRYNQFSIRAQVHKKPKLDLCISSVTHYSSNRENHPPPKPRPVQTDSALWGEDDDEVIFLASQVADEVEQSSQQILAGNATLGGLTFTKFSNEVKTSTQIDKPAEQLLDDFFEGGDDVFVNFADDLVKNACDKGNKEAERKNGYDFKIPTHPAPKERPSTSKSSVVVNTARSGTLPVRKDPKELQINYLRNSLSESEKKNEQLSKDISDLAEKIQTKEGEVSMLRHKLEHLKQTNDALRFDKMKESETFRKEWQHKIEDLEKQLKAQQSELEFKNVEISNLKAKRLNDTQRLNASMCEFKKDYQCLPSVLHLHLSTEFHKRLRLVEPIPEDIFRKSPEMIFSFRENTFRRHLKQLQSILAQVHTHKVLNQHSVKSLSQEVLEICKSIIPELHYYVKNLDYPQYRDTSSFVEYKFLCKELNKYPSCAIHRETARSIYQEQPLYPSEKVIIRRIFAALSLICKRLAPVWTALFSEKVEDLTLIQILVEAIHLIGYSREIFHHNGLVASFAALLNSSTYDSKENNEILSKYTKYLIFCRPSSRALVEISQFLRTISSSSEDNHILKSLCVKSDADSCSLADYYKMLQFTSDSCELQVYSALLAGTFRQYECLQHQTADALASICYNHIKFIRNCFDQQAHWILSASSQTSCDCYVRTASTFIILLHLVLNQWIADPKTIEIKRISKIARAGSLLLYDILYKYFKKGVLLVHGSAVKHRLQLTYDWLHEHKKLFRFRRPHTKSIDIIHLPQIMADPLKNPSDLPEPESISDGNKIWSDALEHFM